jgi:hypothetical protein
MAPFWVLLGAFDRSLMTTADTTTQLAILSDALVKIIDLGPLGASGAASHADLLSRAEDIAAQALAAAATYGQLPPFSEAVDEQ